MLNAKEANELVKQHAKKMEMERLRRITKYLDSVGVRIHNASLCGKSHITVEDMENLAESEIAVSNMELLGYDVSRHATSDHLTICW